MTHKARVEDEITTEGTGLSIVLCDLSLNSFQLVAISLLAKFNG